MRFLTEQQLKQIASSHEVILFGAGHYAEKTLNILPTKPSFLVDNNLKKQGVEFEGLPVFAADTLPTYLSSHPNAFIIICVQKYSEVITQLKSLGISLAERVAITPVARDQGVIDDIRAHDATVMFSNYDAEGGLYRHQLATGETQKIATGSIRGFQQIGDYLYYVSYAGLRRLDTETYKEVGCLELDEYDFCGLIYDATEQCLIVGDTQSDRVLFVDEQSLSVKRTLKFSDKAKDFGRECHHVNDLVVLGDYVLASVFSVSGWWRQGLNDGGIIELHKRTGQLRTIPVMQTWFPHSLCEHDGQLWVLDSMHGTLLKGLKDIVFQADGFLRGLAFNGRYCYIGQSLHRHVSRLEDRMTISADSGIHIFNLDTRMRRFISLPEMTNIYQIEVIA